MIRKIWIVVFSLIVTAVSVFAQSSTDIELAKQIAKQQGYSESQIEEMIKQKQGAGVATDIKKQQSKTIDRNASVKEQQQQQQQQQQFQYQYGNNQQSLMMNNVAGGQQMQQLNKIDLPGFNGSSLIFGHDIFKNQNLNFIPNYNTPTPDNYKLSAGDEVVIDVWGDVITNITTTVSPEGAIIIPDLGPVYIAGQTVTKAEKSIKEYLSKIYAGISEPTPSTFVKLALGKIRSVTVNVVGDVVTPGSYTLPSLSTIASAMFLAGGPNEIGTIREIKLYRNSKLVSSFDAYEFITKGTYNTNIRIEDNDIIAVGPYSGIVTVLGGAKRPMKYEVKEGETLDKVLAYAGGFKDAAYSKLVHIDRVYSSGQHKGATAHSFDVPAEQFSQFKIANGDIITISENDGRFQNRVKIAGAVWRPGVYSINTTGVETNSNISTLKQLIEAAGGAKEDAYMQKGYIVRLGENRIKEQVSFSLEDIILGSSDIIMFPDDSVQVFSIDSITPKQTVKIYGEINKPSGVRDHDGKEVEYEYRKGMTIGDLILKANGVTDAATLGKIEIARRIGKDDASINKKDTIAVIMHYNLLTKPSDADTKLEPFDILFVRRSASYKPQQAIEVEGEVNYPGTYVIEKNTVRLSDVIVKAQGFNKDAYVKGAKLTRKLTKEEFERLRIAMQIARKQTSDTTAIDSLEIGENYSIAIDMEAAVSNPGSYADVVLRENDIITIPKFNSTVKISGAVLYPNTIGYNPKYKLKDYISNAGGPLQSSLQRKIYMVHMNGSVATKGAKNFKIQPGTEIIVPSKDKKTNTGQSLSAIIGIASSTASLAAMVVTILNQTK